MNAAKDDLLNKQTLPTYLELLNTSKWQSYSNPDIGYSFKYPSDWELDEKYVDDRSIAIKSPNPIRDSSLLLEGRARPFTINIDKNIGFYNFDLLKQTYTTTLKNMYDFAILTEKNPTTLLFFDSSSLVFRDWCLVFNNEQFVRIDMGGHYDNAQTSADFIAMLGVCKTFKFID